MKRGVLALALGLLALLGLTAQPAPKGPIPDRITVEVRTQQDIALKDVAEGKTDVFFYGVQGPDFKALPKETRDKLDVYSIPSGSWSLLLNPIPNAAPYQVKEGSKTYFNPFAIVEVRYALNWLINRKYIVDELLGGDGLVGFTPMTPGQAGTYRYNLIPAKLGMTAEGNEKKAIADIDAAMAKAAALAENKGRLVKKGSAWTFDGEPVSVKFLIRVDEPTGRLREGRYIADQIEKTGLAVERLEYDRVQCSTLAYRGNPADYAWSLYTESWGAGATRAYWDVSIGQMYASWRGAMPGGSNPKSWEYVNSEIDSLTKRISNGLFLDEAEYWRDALRATELGLKDAVRLTIAHPVQIYVAAKSRFNSRMVYGLGDGLNAWSQITADVKPDAKTGERVLRMTQFSAQGSLFTSAADPIGVNGFNDTSSRIVIEPLGDPMTFESPISGLDTPLRVEWKDVETQVKRGEAGLEGQIAVPETALLYSSATKKWEPVGKGKTSFSKGTYTYKFGKWHTGRPIGVADLLYATAFSFEWMSKDGANDKYYERTYEEAARPGNETLKGIVVNKDGSITTWFDFNFPLSKERVAATGALSLRTIPVGVPVQVSWEINEALAKLVAEGSKSSTVYSFSGDPAFTEPDILNAKCLEDLKAKLQEMKKAEYVPAPMQAYLSAREAVASYDAALKWIDEHKNAYISNGPYYLQSFDPKTNVAELRAFRDESYPYTADTWPRFFAGKRARIDSVGLPSTAQRTKDAKITVKVSELEYPADTAKAASAAKVTVTLLGAAEKAYKAVLVKAGQYEATLPAADLKDLKAGSYPVVVEAVVAAEAPAVEPGILVLY